MTNEPMNRPAYEPRMRRQPMLRSRSRFGGVFSRGELLTLAKTLLKSTVVAAGVDAGSGAAVTLLKVWLKSTAATTLLLTVECAAFGDNMVAPTAMAFSTRTAIRTRV